jgi:hypothetical protein
LTFEKIFATIFEISFRRGGEIEGALEHEPHTIPQLQSPAIHYSRHFMSGSISIWARLSREALFGFYYGGDSAVDLTEEQCGLIGEKHISFKIRMLKLLV